MPENHPVAASAAAETVPPEGGLGPRLRAFGRNGVAFCRQQRVWLACMVVLTGTWTAELWMVQRATLVYPNENGPNFAFFAPKIRLLLDLMFISTLVIWLRRRVLVFLVVGSFFVYLGLITYFRYFHKPLSFLQIVNNWREGVQVGGFALDLFPVRHATLLALGMFVSLSAIYVSRGYTLSRKFAWTIGPALASVYGLLYVAAIYYDPLSAIQTTRGVGRLGEIRGYIGPWAAEWYYLGDDTVLNNAIKEARRSRREHNRLLPVEAEIPIHKKLVILQAESLDFNILGHKANGVEVTPFLNRLRAHSMFYRLRAVHSNGSSDADFVALSGVVGSPHVNTYKILNYPYSDTTPQALARCGYATYGFHGNTGEFYNRRGPFEKMGFKGLYFREELEGREGLNADRWGVRDKDVLAFSAQKLRTASGPTCHFIITLTTHTPYTLLSPHELEIYPNPRTTIERYVNNMRYLDNCLRDYVSSLGSGVTVVIYADHPIEEGDDTLAPDRQGAREFIPCFIYDSDRDLSQVQKTRNDAISQNGEINLADVINYLKAQWARDCQPPDKKKEPPQEHAAADRQ